MILSKSARYANDPRRPGFTCWTMVSACQSVSNCQRQTCRWFAPPELASAKMVEQPAVSSEADAAALVRWW
jgi:hypothetical protein